MANSLLGLEVRDVVTGFSGIAVAHTEWLNGCVRIMVQPRQKKGENTLAALESFDIQQLEYLDKAPVTMPSGLTAARRAGGGGGRPEPRRQEVRP